jgi:hypothetical protein
MKKTLKNTLTYEVVVVEDYNENRGNPINCEVNKCDSLKEAIELFEEELAKEYSTNGATCRVEILSRDDDDNTDIVKEGVCVSALLPNGAIIITYKHRQYMHYCYVITGVRYANDGERYENLNYSEDRTEINWDYVCDSLEELEESMNDGRSIFGKIQSGSNLLSEFLDSLN